ncbi:DUF1565 domain-containing protein [Streptomyces afghaniensis]|uniref:right-handed parallel beta-helix repeat-containing protein n=1 Tax=Streptomyces afghaniensis TaxID=66865 RepID=UPI0037D70ED6
MRTAKFGTSALLLSVVMASSVAMTTGLASASAAPAGSIYYVAPNGNDGAAGTQAAPWASIARAQAVAKAGDTVYFRGGTYTYTRANSACSSQTAKVDAITLNRSGSGIWVSGSNDVFRHPPPHGYRPVHQRRERQPRPRLGRA